MGAFNSYGTVSAASRAYGLQSNQITPLSGTSTVSAPIVGGKAGSSYAVFINGAYIDAYSTSLVKTSLSTTNAAIPTASASIGNYVLFTGFSKTSTVVSAYNTSLVKSTPTALVTGRASMSGASNGSYAIFAGGNADGTATTAVDAYNSSLTRSTPTAIITALYGIAGGSSATYAIFAGGSPDGNNTFSTVVQAYNTSLTRSTATSLSEARSGSAAARVGSYILFAGGTCDIVDGSYSYYTSAAIDAYNTSSLVRTVVSDTVVFGRRRASGGTTITKTGGAEECAVFLGGFMNYKFGTYNVVGMVMNDAIAITSSLTERVYCPESDIFVMSTAGVSIANYALFAGGIRIGEGMPNNAVGQEPTPIVQAYSLT